MAQACLKCLKFTMCAANFLCFLCGISVLGFGIYMTLNSKLFAMSFSFLSLNVPNALLITGIIITCVSFLGFLGALRENRCLLLTFFMLLFIVMLVELAVACLLLIYDTQIADKVKNELEKGLSNAKENVNGTAYKDWDFFQQSLHCCGLNNTSDWEPKIPRSCCDRDCDAFTPKYYEQGCFKVLTDFWEENFLWIGVAVIIICVIEVLGMCFAMTLFCHISRTGLGYKL